MTVVSHNDMHRYIYVCTYKSTIELHRGDRVGPGQEPVQTQLFWVAQATGRAAIGSSWSCVCIFGSWSCACAVSCNKLPNLPRVSSCTVA